jgi:hypothetical protein
MTMHLARGLSTLNTKKRKKKPLNQKDIERYTVQWRQHNKRMRQQHMHSMQYDTVEDYIAYCRGEYKPKNTPKPQPYKPDTSWRNDQPKITSVMEEAIKNGTWAKMNGSGAGTKKETIKYTGTLIKGIATMHKSNAVPIINKEQAQDIARMRRG